MPVEVPNEIAFEETLLSRILASRHFAKAPLLSAFLSYVCQRSLREGASRISEQEIGTNVFGRELGYDSREDNIVRNYARQLRRRLDDYYATDGRSETRRIQIPKGGYVPLVLRNEDSSYNAASALAEEAEGGAETANEISAEGDVPSRSYQGSRWPPQWPWIAATVTLALALLLCSIVILRLMHIARSKSTPAKSVYNHALWAEIFAPNRDTLIVPSDTAFVTLEDLHQRIYSLSEYMSWSAVEYPVPNFEEDLRTRKYTSLVDLEVLSRLARLPEWRADRSFLRTSRNLHIEDLKDDNVILLGSVYSIPWVALLENELNFRFIYRPKENRAWIENRQPAAGEAATYANHWSGVAETDYAVIAFVPNLNHTGHILLLEGLDGSGTDAAEDMLFRSDDLENILAIIRRADGSLGGVEVLLESSSVDSHSTGTRIVSVHTLK